MPLPTPILDDRSYQQLRDELVRRIPVYAPEWTDLNPSDPGIALLELFSFLGENLLFRFNQIPETTQLRFLRLLDIPLRPAQAARAIVAFTTELPAGRPVDAFARLGAGSVSFEGSGLGTHVWPVSLVAVARVRTDPPADDEARDFAARALDALGGLQPGQEPAYYENERLAGDPAAADATTLHVQDTVDGMLWAAVVGGRAASLDALLGEVLTVGFIPDEQVAGIADRPACPGAQDAPTGPDVRWEASTGRSADSVPLYHELKIEADTTRGLTRPGVVQLRLPSGRDRLGDFAIFDPDLRGSGAYPPDLDDEQLIAGTLFWMRVWRADGEPLGNVRWLGANALEVEQALTADPELVGTGTGEAGQRLALVQRPILADTLVLEVEEADGRWRPWTVVDDFGASREDDRHYMLDRATGQVRFGDFVRGRPPQIGERIRATHYRYGGGAAGTVAPKAISRVQDVAGVAVANPLAAVGGTDAESAVAALDRVPGELRKRDRAVCAGDFRELALATPGVDVARADCLPLLHPRHPEVDAAGVVSVVVWTRTDAHHPSAPRPLRSELDRVCAWLDPRRLVTTELYVIPPTYRPLALSVGIEVEPGYGIEPVSRWVEAVLRQYLSPLPPYGPEGAGWPLGRRVYGPELEAAALQVEGVRYLDGLRVAGQDESGAWIEGPVDLERWEVPELLVITVADEAGDPGAELAPPPGGTPVPVRAPKERC